MGRKESNKPTNYRRGPYASSKGLDEPVAYAQSRQSLRCSHAKRKEIDDESSQAFGL